MSIPVLPVQGPRNADRPEIPPPPEAQLILDSSEQKELTSRRDVDTHTALTRGLAQYLQPLSTELNGQEFRFKAVFDTWAEPDEKSRFPAAAVYSTEEGHYDASRFNPSLALNRTALPDGRFVVRVSEFVQELVIDIWTTSPKERTLASLMVEEALNPVDFKYGFKLTLPFYHNQVAIYEMLRMTYVEAEEEAMRRYRRVHFFVQATIGVLQLRRLPLARPRMQLTVDS